MKAGPTCKTILFTALFESEHILYQNEVTYSKRGYKLRMRLQTQTEAVYIDRISTNALQVHPLFDCF